MKRERKKEDKGKERQDQPENRCLIYGVIRSLLPNP